MPELGDVMRDKEQVRENLYGDPAKLGARVVLQSRFSTNPVSVVIWELGLVDLSGVCRALDAGCGTGNFLLPLARRLAPHGAELVGLDLAEGTLGVARKRAQAEGLPVTFLIGDVEALPFDDAAFDLVLANYMLYHVPDLDRAITELRRVLRPGGTLLAATNGVGHMRELWALGRQALVRAGVANDARARLALRGQSVRAMSFRLENGEEWLRRRFDDVRLERYPDELRVTELEPLVAYFESMWTVDEMVAAMTGDPAEQAGLRKRVFDAFREVTAERLGRDGVIVIAKDTGAFVAH
jgi:SAM-dependent methyltransferase